MTAQLRAIDTQRDQAEALLAQPEVSAAEQQPAPDLEALARVAATARDEATRARRAQTIAESAEHRLHDLAGEVHAILERIGPAEAEQAVVQELADCVGRHERQQHAADAAVRLRARGPAGEGRARWPTSGCRSMGEGRYPLVHSDALAAARRPQRPGPAGRSTLDRRAATPRPSPAASRSWPRWPWPSASADAVREEAGGFDLQTLFIDEGFGTLDDESLEQVMARARRPARGRPRVGVVSHVSRAAPAHPRQLRVTKSQAARIEVCPRRRRGLTARGRRDAGTQRHVRPAARGPSCPVGGGTGLGWHPRGSVTPRRPPAAGRSRPGCGRRRRRRCGRPAASTCRGASTPTGKAAVGAVYGWSHSPASDARGVRRVRAAGCRPPATRPPRPASISPRIAIIASQNRSISPRSSVSVGSTISVPATGKDIVGAWKP